MEERPTEKRVAFLVVIFFCLVMGTSALTVVNFLMDSSTTDTIQYHEERIEAIEKELNSIQKPLPKPSSNIN